MPAACSTWVATTLEVVTMRARLRLKWEGIWRPPDEGSVERAKTPIMKSRAVMPSATQKARSR